VRRRRRKHEVSEGRDPHAMLLVQNISHAQQAAITPRQQHIATP
jgi:hypothetical protein